MVGITGHRNRSPGLARLARAVVIIEATAFMSAQLTAGMLSGPVLDEGLAVEIHDLIQMPASAVSPPLARVNVLREAPDESGRLFMNDLRGPLLVIDAGKVSTYMDLSALVPTLLTEGGRQMGFVSFALHPGFAQNGLLYTAHTEQVGAPANLVPALPIPTIHHAVLTEWQTSNPAANTFNGTSRELMRIASAHPTHNLGEVGFDTTLAPGHPDYGLLYVAAGDFGSVQRDDADQLQRLDTVYGALLRIDPLGSGFERAGVTYDYGIPSSNPFANDGDAQTFDEIFAFGFRNPQNFHFDRERPDLLYVAEIGQGNLEEVDLPFAGSNHGWPAREGTFALDVSVDRETVFPLPADDATFGFIYPAVQYDHDEGVAIAGGIAVRESPQSALSGKFVFGDIVSGRLFYSDIAAMLAADDSNPATTADVFELHLMRDGVATTLLQVVRDALGDATVSRVDLRFSTDLAGRLLVSTKQDGFVRELVPACCGPAAPEPVTVPIPLFTLWFAAALLMMSGINSARRRNRQRS